MVVSTHDGQIYEDQTDYHLDNPMESPLAGKAGVDALKESSNYDPKTDVYQASEEQKDHKLFFVRHGETEDNEDDVVRTKDSKLTDTGRKQAEVAAKQLKSEGVDAIVSSNLPRAKESAHIIAAKLGIVPQFDNKLNTWGMGKLEGLPCDAEVNKQMKDAVEKTPDEPVGGEESFNDFKDRAFSGIKDAINNNQGKKLAILTHNKVEATLKAWHNTGQDNPSIDPKEVSKEREQPGSVEPFTMKTNSTIMQGDSFEDRFPKQIENLPNMNQVPIDKGFNPPGWWRNESVKKDPELDEYPGQRALKNWPKDMDLYFPGKPIAPYTGEGIQTLPLNEETATGRFQPMGLKMYPGKGPTTQSDTPLSRFAEEAGDTLAEQLMAILQDPTAEIPLMLMGGVKGSRTRGVGRPMRDRVIDPKEELKRFNQGSKNRIEETLSFEKAAEETKANLAKQRQKNPRARFRGEAPDWFKEEMNDPETKALSDWYKNQFEGGPIENEKKLLEDRVQARIKEIEETQPYRNLSIKRKPKYKIDKMSTEQPTDLSEWMKNQFEGGPIEPEKSYKGKGKITREDTVRANEPKNIFHEDFGKSAQDLADEREAMYDDLSRWYKNQGEKETITAAAIRMTTPKGETIYTGHSHLNAMLNMSKEHTDLLNLPKQPKGVSYEDGFKTSTGRFVNRKEAAKIHQTTKGRYTELSEKMDLPPLMSEEVPAIKKQRPELTDKDRQELIDEWERIVNKK
jgi:2,3-bisphosphoglycerate-dependent phosphoglycerate mutase